MFKRICAILCLVMFLGTSVAIGCTLPEGSEILIFQAPGQTFLVQDDVEVRIMTPEEMEQLGVPSGEDVFDVVVDPEGYIIAVPKGTLKDCD